MPIECVYCGHSIYRTSQLKKCPCCKRRGGLVFYPDEEEIRKRAESIKAKSLKETRDAPETRKRLH